MALLRLAHILRLGLAVTDLHSGIAIGLNRPRRHNPHLIKVQHRDRHMRAVVLE